MTTKTGGIPVQLVKVKVKNVDGVDGPANETPFLMMKSAIVPGEDDGQEDDGAAGVEVDVEAEPDDSQADDEPEAAEVEPGETPGDSAWEKQDSATATKAATMLASIKQLVCDLIGREQAEDSDADVSQLQDMMCGLDWVLGGLAKFSFTEGADSDAAADAEKNGDQADDDTESGSAPDDEEAPVTKAVTTEDVTSIVTGLVNEKFTQVMKAVEALKPSTPAETKPSTEDAATAAQPVVKQADEVSEVLKSTLPHVLKPITKAMGDLAEVVAGMSERLAAVEAQDAQAGPLLKGAQPQVPSHLWGERPDLDPYRGYLPGGLNTPEALAKAVGGIQDPRARDEAGRDIALAMHPLLFSNKQ